MKSAIDICSFIYLACFISVASHGPIVPTFITISSDLMEISRPMLIVCFEILQIYFDSLCWVAP